MSLPEPATSHNNLGHVLSELGRRKEALDATREAVEIRIPLARQWPEAFAGRLRMAAGNLRELLDGVPGNHPAWEVLREAEAVLGEAGER